MKCCLRTELSKGGIGERLFNKINADVNDLSKLKVEFSLYALHVLSKGWEDGLFQETGTLDARRLIYPLCILRKEPSKLRYPMDLQYKALRDKRGIQLHNIDKRHQTVKLIYQNFEKEFHTNLTTHARQRMAKFLLFQEKERIENTLDAFEKATTTRETTA